MFLGAIGGVRSRFAISERRGVPLLVRGRNKILRFYQISPGKIGYSQPVRFRLSNLFLRL